MCLWSVKLTVNLYHYIGLYWHENSGDRKWEARAYIAVTGKETLETNLIVDKQVINEILVYNVPFALMSAFLCTIFVILEAVISFI